MSISKYRAFLCAVQMGSLSKAAEQLGYTQSGVSHLIMALEDEVGFPVLGRSRSGVTLTAEGLALLPALQELDRCYSRYVELAQSMQGLEEGKLCVGTFASVAVHWLPSIIKAFKAAYPNVEIQLCDGVYQDVESNLLEKRIDCGFLPLSAHEFFDLIPLKQDRMLAVLPAQHPLCVLERIPFQALAHEPFIIPGEGANYDIGRIFKENAVSPNILLEMRDDYSALAMVRNGLGVSILPELVLRGFPTDTLRIMELENSPTRTIALAVNRTPAVSPAVKAFIGVVKKTVALL